jgi:hypothetical protein
MKQLLKETKIGKSLSIGVSMEKAEVGLFIASADVSAGCGFKFDEWEKFVECVNKANERYLKTKK